MNAEYKIGGILLCVKNVEGNTKLKFIDWETG